MRRSTFAVATLAGGLAALALASTAVAERPQRGSDQSGRRGINAAGFRMVQGRIVSADAARREFVVRGMMMSSPGNNQGGQGSREQTGTSDQGNTGRTTSDNNRGSADRGSSSGTGRGSTGAGQGKTFTFQLSPTARITLDGKQAQSSDLRSDLFVRVLARQGTSQANSDTGSGRNAQTGTGRNANQNANQSSEGSNRLGGGSSANEGSGNSGTSGQGARMTAERVDAFTRAPTGFQNGNQQQQNGNQQQQRNR